MEQLVINNPVNLKLEVIEIDDYLPSFKVFIEFLVKYPSGLLKYEAENIWFQCSNWDSFLKQLNLINKGTVNEIILHDMSEYFSFKLQNSKGEYYMTISWVKTDNGFGSIKVEYSKSIDGDTLSLIKEKFIEFNKWW
jgi:hypothetical protein